MTRTAMRLRNNWRFLYTLIIPLLITVSVAGQDLNPDSGFVSKVEAKNLLVNGLKNGKWVEYLDMYGKSTSDSLGRFRLTIYKNGKPQGIAREYDVAGRSDTDLYVRFYLDCETPYVDGVINGVEKHFYENEKLRWETFYNHGKQIETKSYDTDGNEIKKDEH